MNPWHHTCSIHRGHRRPLGGVKTQGVPSPEDARHLPDWVLDTRANKWTQRAPVLQSHPEKEREKKKKNDTGMPGGSRGDPTHDKVMWKRPDEQGGSGLEGPPGPARESTPKPESVCLTILCLSPTLLTWTGGYPQPPFSGKSQLTALINKSAGHDRSVSIQTPLMAF